MKKYAVGAALLFMNISTQEPTIGIYVTSDEKNIIKNLNNTYCLSLIMNLSDPSHGGCFHIHWLSYLNVISHLQSKCTQELQFNKSNETLETSDVINRSSLRLYNKHSSKHLLTKTVSKKRGRPGRKTFLSKDY